MDLTQFFKDQFGTWYEPLEGFINTDAFKQIGTQIGKRRKETVVYPSSKDTFNVFRAVDWDKVRVVVLGQDPYYTPSTAYGVAFGVSEEYCNSLKPFPPSLENILLEVEQDVYDGLHFPDHTLQNWLDQGVLLLNTALTVERGKPESHLALWKPFTEYVVKTISDNKPGTIWMLWGSKAKAYKKLINENTNHILESGHPSPLSANKGYWFGNKHFSKANAIIASQNGEEFKIKW
jgi:uracil-DNA glycosylase